MNVTDYWIEEWQKHMAVFSISTAKSVTFNVTDDDVIDGKYYDIYGQWIGRSKNDFSDNVYAVPSAETVIFDSNNNIIKAPNKIPLNITHEEFTTISHIIFQESSHGDEEDLWLAHTANNFAQYRHKSLYSLLMGKAYSCAPKKEPMPDELNKKIHISARAAVINVLMGKSDPTGGAYFWDGTDFLAKGVAHNKFKEYKSISIPKNIYSQYEKAQLDRYGRQVSYTIGNTKKTYNLPNEVFTNPQYWGADIFFYGENSDVKNKNLIAVGTKGRTIFWKVN